MLEVLFLKGQLCHWWLSTHCYLSIGSKDFLFLHVFITGNVLLCPSVLSFRSSPQSSCSVVLPCPSPQDPMAPCFSTLLSLPPDGSLLWGTDLPHGHTRWEVGTERPALIAGAALGIMSFWKPRLGIWTHFPKYMVTRLWFHSNIII